jgi:hypothetical protein
MKQLSTIQKLENLNDVFAIDVPGPGGAHHLYQVCKHNTGRISEEDGTFRTRPENMVLTVQMQYGGRNAAGSISGAVDADLLEIVRDRLRDFQAGPYSCRENACALTHIEEALMWLNRRVEDRITRGVLGTEQE